MPAVCGVDLALVHTAVTTLMTNRNGGLVCIAAKLVETAKADEKLNLYVAVDDAQRAALLYKGIMEELRESRPVLVAVELPSGSQSAVSAKAGGIATGVIASIREALPEVSFLWLRENQIKLSLLGKRSGSKEEIAKVVLARIPDLAEHLAEIPKTKREHITDAAAVVLAAEGADVWRAAMREGGQ